MVHLPQVPAGVITSINRVLIGRSVHFFYKYFFLFVDTTTIILCSKHNTHFGDLLAIEATGHGTRAHVIAYSQRRPSHTSSKSRPILQETSCKKS